MIVAIRKTQKGSGTAPVAPGGSRKAFTLVEVLVAMSVLGLIFVIVSQIFNTSSTAISQSSKSMSALDASQTVFQQIALDISRMVLRDDVDYSFVKNAAGSPSNLPGNDLLSFYANTQGLSTTGSSSSVPSRALAVVDYQVVQNATTKLLELDYGAQQIDWNNSGTNPFVLTSAIQLLTTPNTLPVLNPGSSLVTMAPEVIRMEICFQLASDPAPADNPPKLLTPATPVYISPSNVPRPIRNVAGLLVGIVVIDPKSRQLLPSGADIKVASLFPDALANEDLLSLWTPKNTASQLRGAGLPPAALGGVHLYQKYFPLPW
jgi:prepilin-type N-terminal cleavage/methylation domain-containing protein